MLIEMVFILIGYLCGSIPVGFFLVRALKGFDVREHGSGNIGAANVGRILGKKGFIITMLLDMLKGVIAVLIARCYVWFSSNIIFSELESSLNESLRLGLFLGSVAASAMIGHSFPVWLKFRGGKAASVAAGVSLVLHPFTFIIIMSVWGIVLKKTKYTSLANIISGSTSIITYWFFVGTDFWYNENWIAVIIAIIMFLLIIWRHKDNIKRLREGTERKLGQKN